MLDRLGTVAVIDDDPAVLDSLKFLLEVSGYPVAVYPTATEFLRGDQARPSCMILDHHIPGMSGLQLAAKLRAEGSNLPILLITGMPSPEIAAEAQRLRIERVLEKPPFAEVANRPSSEDPPGADPGQGRGPSPGKTAS